MEKKNNFKPFIAIVLAFVFSFQFNLAFSQGTAYAQDNELTLYVVRHGKTILNALDRVQGWIDSPLTAEGRSVAEDLGVGLSDVKFDAVYTSDRGRTIETAEIVLSYNNQASSEKINQLEDLRETYYGDYEGKPNAVMAADAFAQLGLSSMEEFYSLENPMRQFVDAGSKMDKTGRFETYDELSRRVMRGIDQIANLNDSGNVLVVVHGNVINVILEQIGYDQVIEPKNSSVTTIKYKDGKYTIGEVNEMRYAESGNIDRIENNIQPKVSSTEIDNSEDVGTGKVEVYLVRHGKTILNTDDKVQGWSDSPLTDEGVRGAVHAGIGLKDIKFDYVFSSDLGRATETTYIILGQNQATDKNVSFERLSGFRETNFGKYEGEYNSVMWADFANSAGFDSIVEFQTTSTMSEIFKAMDVTAAKDETGTFELHSDVQKRVSAALDYATQKAARNGGGKIMIVAHGMIITDILAGFGVDNPGGVANSSVSILNYENGVYEVASSNDTSYIKAGEQNSPYSKAPEDYFASAASNADGTLTVGNVKYAPLRETIEAEGGKVYWEGRKGAIVILLDGVNTTLIPGSNHYFVDGEIRFMASDEFTVIGNTEVTRNIAYVPSRLIAR